MDSLQSQRQVLDQILLEWWHNT